MKNLQVFMRIGDVITNNITLPSAAQKIAPLLLILLIAFSEL